MSLGLYRENLDAIDLMLLELFQQRMDTVKKIALYKLDHNLEIFQPQREEEIINEKCKLAKEEYKEFTKEYFSELMNLSKAYQQTIIKEKNRS